MKVNRLTSIVNSTGTHRFLNRWVTCVKIPLQRLWLWHVIFFPTPDSLYRKLDSPYHSPELRPSPLRLAPRIHKQPRAQEEIGFFTLLITTSFNQISVKWITPGTRQDKVVIVVINIVNFLKGGGHGDSLLFFQVFLFNESSSVSSSSLNFCLVLSNYQSTCLYSCTPAWTFLAAMRLHLS